MGRMKIFRWGLLLILMLLSGCCSYPGLFDKVHRSVAAVQSFYGPLLEEEWQQNDKARMAVVAADTTLLLAGELQKQWCPDPGQTEQLELQAKQAQNLAQEAGVAPGGAVPAAAPEADGK
jgi:hypothetical protein